MLYHLDLLFFLEFFFQINSLFCRQKSHEAQPQCIDVVSVTIALMVAKAFVVNANGFVDVFTYISVIVSLKKLDNTVLIQ